jgi:LysM repeat protein
MKKSTKRLLSFALASTVVAGVPVVASAESNQEENALEETVSNTTNYIVKEGDTLGKIAERFYGNSAYYVQLAEYNRLTDPALIFPGQILSIPKDLSVTYYDYYNNEVTVVANTYEEDKTYTVKEGDTLYCIVRVQYGLTNQEAVDKLATYNGLSDPNRISRGQVLLIPCKDKLLQVVQNDYTAEYNRMGWILNHPYGCKPCDRPWWMPEPPVCPEPPKPECPEHPGHPGHPEHPGHHHDGPCLTLKP